MKNAFLTSAMMVVILIGTGVPAWPKSNSGEIQELAKEIDSVEKAKSYLRNSIRCPDPTGCSGYGMWIRAVNVCNVVKALNIRVGGKIIPGSSSSKMGTIRISKSDVYLMKTIYSQCKLKRYIDSASNPIELVYWPSSKVGKFVDKSLF